MKTKCKTGSQESILFTWQRHEKQRTRQVTRIKGSQTHKYAKRSRISYVKRKLQAIQNLKRKGQDKVNEVAIVFVTLATEARKEYNQKLFPKYQEWKKENPETKLSG
jgi:hypothetical protein